MAKCPKCDKETDAAKCPDCGADTVESTGADSPDSFGDAANSTGTTPPTGRVYNLNDRRAEKERRYESRAKYDRPRDPFTWIATFVRYMRDPDVSILRKLPVGGLVAYIIWPFDILADLAPVIGWVDDAAAVVLLWRYVSDELAAYYREHRRMGRR